MAHDIRDAIIRSRSTLIADCVGAAALVVLLMGSLSLPHLF
ncbi:hypothetical protein [Wenxinia marina]|uniref:Uncharacterized protein n=1 Tax=Wenxinia marina DSM 24838 TaxID=1123501 RepID=A0A0D0PBF2_9RHOB|nr:hypothetical protein [Wenxinia marina]KIQ68746.1 hypothetical protein Wenmar_02472 [Wenxinia marina DSM 24838]GGL65487.1 hypothetical protein GCM10011392_20240 [Wenxinia marina]